MNVLMWFRQDLRIHDHAALTLAAGLGAVVPVYIFDPEQWVRSDTSARQFQFIAESVEDLRADLASLGAALLIRTGPVAQVLARLCARHAITTIVTQGSAPRALTDWAAASGIAWLETEQPLQGEPLPPPALRCVADLISTPLPVPQLLRLGPDACAHRQRGGRGQALDLLNTFLTTRGESYHRAQAQPHSAERASSRLSPHLAQGTVSLRELDQAITARLAERPSGRWTSALGGFGRKLAARAVLPPCPAPDLAAIAATSALNAWLLGQTGLPFLDALMRYLAATGWLNEPLRALVLSLGVHHLGLDPMQASAGLARRLTDYDPALFWPQALRIAGLTAEAPRLFHPIKQALDLDPDGQFTRHWLPELAAVPDSCLQSPWKWAGAARLLGRRYPEPMIDIATAHRAAQEAIWARFGRPLRVVAQPSPALIENPAQPLRGQLRLEF